MGFDLNEKHLKCRLCHQLLNTSVPSGHRCCRGLLSHHSFSQSVFHSLVVALEARVDRLEATNRQLRRQLTALRGCATASAGTSGQVVVRTDDKTLLVEADTREPIAALLKRVRRLDKSSAEVMVFLANRALEEDKCLDDYSVHRLDNPLLLFVVRKAVRLSVRIDRQKSYAMDMSADSTVGDVLRHILREEAFEAKHLVLCFRNQALEESRSLFSYKIRDGNFVFLNTKCELKLRANNQ